MLAVNGCSACGERVVLASFPGPRRRGPGNEARVVHAERVMTD